MEQKIEHLDQLYESVDYLEWELDEPGLSAAERREITKEIADLRREIAELEEKLVKEMKNAKD